LENISLPPSQQLDGSSRTSLATLCTRVRKDNRRLPQIFIYAVSPVCHRTYLCVISVILNRVYGVQWLRRWCAYPSLNRWDLLFNLTASACVPRTDSLMPIGSERNISETRESVLKTCFSHSVARVSHEVPTPRLERYSSATACPKREYTQLTIMIWYICHGVLHHNVPTMRVALRLEPVFMWIGETVDDVLSVSLDVNRSSLRDLKICIHHRMHRQNLKLGPEAITLQSDMAGAVYIA
ncbi:hypothetical protein KCV07_g396, partial [Aureobasidium melanogenum]